MERADQGSPLPADPAGREDIVRDTEHPDDPAVGG